jgi:RNA polymerase primary sigma factor
MLIDNESLKVFLAKVRFAIENPPVPAWKGLSNERLYTLYTNATDVSEKKQIKDYLVVKNVPYVVNKSNAYYCNTSVTKCDLVNAGIKGVIIAIDKYNPAKGTKLITILGTYIFNMINEVLRKDSFTVNVAENAIDDLNRIRRFELTDEYILSKKYMTKEELIQLTIDETKITLRRYNNAMAARTHMSSPAEFVQETMETISDADHLGTNPELILIERYESEQRSRDVQSVIEGLSELDRKVIHLMYGGVEKLSIAQVANALNVSSKEVEKSDSRVRKALKPIAFRFSKPKPTNTKKWEEEV